MDLIILVIILVVVLGGSGFYGYRSGHFGGRGLGMILGLLLLVLILYIIFGGGFPRLP
jgi:hypothetical protein